VTTAPALPLALSPSKATQAAVFCHVDRESLRWIAGASAIRSPHAPTLESPSRLRGPGARHAIPTSERSMQQKRPEPPSLCHCCRFAIILDTTKTLLSKKRPAQLDMQLASDESSLAPGLVMHLSKQVSVSLLIAAWMTAFCCSVSMKFCRSLVWWSESSGSSMFLDKSVSGD